MSEIESTARNFVQVAFHELSAQNAIPTSASHLHLQRHLDFSMDDLAETAEYAALKAAVIAASPEGLPTEGEIPDAAFTVALLIESLLELCISDCALTGNYDPDGEEVTAAIEQLVDVTAGRPYDIVVARHVSHLVTDSGGEIEIDGIVIVPENHQTPTVRIRHEIPDAHHAWNRRPPHPHRPPCSLVMARESVSGVASEFGLTSSRRLDDFLLALRLLTGATILGMYQVSGSASRVSTSPARLRHLNRATHTPLVRRVARLRGTEGPALAALTKLVKESHPPGKDLMFSSFGQAVRKFAGLDDTTGLFEQLVDLATALEGVILAANEGEGLTLRLCTRTAALLAHTDDPAGPLFEDLKRLYNLRSKVVHGGELTTKQLLKDLSAMDCVPDAADDTSVLFRLAIAVDRLRDIVRRAILARMCLAAGEHAVWPFKDDTGKVKVDTLLSDDANRVAWRTHWRTTLESLGAAEAARRSDPPVYSLGPEDR